MVDLLVILLPLIILLTCAMVFKIQQFLRVESKKAISGYSSSYVLSWAPIQGTHKPIFNEGECEEARLKRLREIAHVIFRRKIKCFPAFSNICHMPEGNPFVPEVLLLGEIIRAKQIDKEIAKSNSRRLAGTPSAIAHILKMLFHRHKTARLFNASHPQKPQTNARSSRGIHTYLVDKSFYISVPPRLCGNHVHFDDAIKECSLLYNYVHVRPNIRHIYYLIRAHKGKNNELSPRDIDMLKFLSRELLHKKRDSCELNRSRLTIILIDADKQSTDPMDISFQLRKQGIHDPVIGIGMDTSQGIETLRIDMLKHCLAEMSTEKLSLRAFKRMHALAPSKALMLPKLSDDGWVTRNVHRSKEFLVKRKQNLNYFFQKSIAWSGSGYNNNVGVAYWRYEAQSKDGLCDSLSFLCYSRNLNPKALFRKSLIGDIWDRLLKQRNISFLVYSMQPCRSSALTCMTTKQKKKSKEAKARRRKNLSAVRALRALCQEEQRNPFLAPPQFIAHRTDFCFRLPSQGNTWSRRMAAHGSYYIRPKRVHENRKSHSLPHFPYFQGSVPQPTPINEFKGYAANLGDTEKVSPTEYK